MSWWRQYFIYCRFRALNWQCCFLLALLVSLQNFKEIALFNLVVYIPKAFSPVDFMNRMVLDFGITWAFQEVSIAWAITWLNITSILYIYIYTRTHIYSHSVVGTSLFCQKKNINFNTLKTIFSYLLLYIYI